MVSIISGTWKMHQSIAVKFAAAMFFVSVVTCSALTILLLYLDYKQSLGRTEHAFESIKANTEKKLVSALLHDDDVTIAAVVDAVSMIPYVEGVMVVKDDKPLFTRGSIRFEQALVYTYPLVNPYGKGGDVHDFVTIAATPESLGYRLDQLGLDMFGGVIALALIGALFKFGLFHVTVGRHLKELAVYSRNLDLMVLDLPLQLNRRKRNGKADELDLVVKALNSMRRSLKESLASLQEKQSELEAIVTNSSDAIVSFDERCRVTYSNPAACRNVGLPLKDVLGKKHIELGFSGEVSHVLDKAVQDVFAHGVPAEVSFELEAVKGKRFYELFLTPDLTGEGKVGSVIGISRDITDRVQGEAVLREAFQHMPLLASITDIADGRFEEVNDTFLAVTGYDREQVIGSTSVEIGYIRREDRRRIVSLLDSAGYFENLEMELRRKDGSSLTCLFFGTTIVVDGRKKCLVLAQDISEKKRIEEEQRNLQERLSQVGRMEAIGTLASGIAHDFNNILAAILGYGQLVQERLSSESSLHGHIDQIIRAGNRAADLVKQILTFSRQGRRGQPRPMHIQPVVNEVVKLLKSTVPSTIALKQYLDPDCGAVFADLTQVHQVVLNICTNAHQAIGCNQGAITITLKEKILDSRIVSVDGRAIEPGRYAELIISDSGKGIPEEVQTRIFDPFFSTKGHAGTGLGLSVTMGIVAGHNGAMLVESEEGVGTTFKVYLPVIESESDVEQEDVCEKIHGTENIMIVDDEYVLADMLKQALDAYGYKVKIFGGSSEALTYFLRNFETVDLVVTDMTMPVMTGTGLAREMLKVRPGLPVILCTGYISESVTEESVKSAGITEVVAKPVVGKQLAKIIRRSLDRGKDSGRR